LAFAILPLPLQSHPDHRHLPSFPTRRSSDLCSMASSVEERKPAWLAFSRTSHIDMLFVFASSRALSTVVLPIPLPGKLMMRLSADRKSTRLNSSHVKISYAVFCLKKKNR